MRKFWQTLRARFFSSRVQKLWWIGGGSVTILLIASAILNLLTPSTPPITITNTLTTNLDNSTSTVLDVRFSGDESTLPESVFVSTTTNNSSLAQQVVSNLKRIHSLKESPYSKTIWNGPVFSLVFSPDINQYQLTRNGAVGKGSTPLDIQKATQVATEFLAELLPNQTLTPLTNEITYLDSSLDAETVPPSEAETAIIPFALAINDNPIYPANVNTHPFEVLVTHEYEVQKVTWFPYLPTINTTTPTKRISVAQAIENMKKGVVSVIFAADPNFQLPSLSTLQSVDIAEANIEYRYDPQQEQVVPMFRFTGTAVDARGTTLFVTLLTPALNTTTP